MTVEMMCMWPCPNQNVLFFLANESLNPPLMTSFILFSSSVHPIRRFFLIDQSPIYIFPFEFPLKLTSSDRTVRGVLAKVSFSGLRL